MNKTEQTKPRTQKEIEQSLVQFFSEIIRLLGKDCLVLIEIKNSKLILRGSGNNVGSLEFMQTIPKSETYIG